MCISKNNVQKRSFVAAVSKMSVHAKPSTHKSNVSASFSPTSIVHKSLSEWEAEIYPSARKRVSFAPSCTFHCTIARNDYTEEETAVVWYSQQELNQIRTKAAKLVELLEKSNGYLGHKRYCTRGLEGHTRAGYKNKMMNRGIASMVVLDEQDRQLSERGVINYGIIAVAYQQVSSRCQLCASVVGESDSKAAAALYCEADFEMLQTLRPSRPSRKEDTEKEMRCTENKHAENWMSTQRTEVSTRL
ncbi:hypothetical protein IV203_007094 [Nitzschia inconspicua]|uniref:Uncharacterized protein n=1 Tax=Nitzschia inconspicua TaxID=303405 RepID=A0A9K3KE03_9STRA|nr:hypothetical protein IV203_007094 [Nitzschia inconspicua]